MSDRLTPEREAEIRKWYEAKAMSSPVPDVIVAEILAGIDALRADLTASQAQVAAAQDEIAWLIERGGLCLGFCEYRFKWVTFTNDDALRFARSRDAYSFMECVKWTPFSLPLEGAKVTDHMWCAHRDTVPSTAPAALDTLIQAGIDAGVEYTMQLHEHLEGWPRKIGSRPTPESVRREVRG